MSEQQIQQASRIGAATNPRSQQPTFGRYSEIPFDRMSPEQQDAYKVLAQVEGDGSPDLPGPLKIWVSNPALGAAIAPLAKHFRPPHHSLTQREREIAVCVIVGKWRAHFSIGAHADIALGLGLSADQVSALTCGLPTSFADRQEQLIYKVAVALVESRFVPRVLYEDAIAVLGHDRVTDVTVLMGFYTAISLTLAFYDVPADAAGLKR